MPSLKLSTILFWAFIALLVMSILGATTDMVTTNPQTKRNFAVLLGLAALGSLFIARHLYRYLDAYKFTLYALPQSEKEALVRRCSQPFIPPPEWKTTADGNVVGLEQVTYVPKMEPFTEEEGVLVRTALTDIGYPTYL